MAFDNLDTPRLKQLDAELKKNLRILDVYARAITRVKDKVNHIQDEMGRVRQAQRQAVIGLTPDLDTFAYEVIHNSEDETHLTFGEGSDVQTDVWVGWTGSEFDVEVVTYYHRGTIPATRLYPEEHYGHTAEDHYTFTKLTEMVQVLALNHGINLQEAVE